MARTRLFAALRNGEFGVPHDLEGKVLPRGFRRGWDYRPRSFGGTRGGDRAAGWDLDAAVAEGYERNVWTFRCVELIAGNASSLPFRVAENYDTDDQRVLDDHPLYRPLNVRANPLEKGRDFRKRLSAQTLLSKKGAFVEVTRSRAGIITRLDLWDPSRVELLLSDNDDYIDHFEYTDPRGVVHERDPERIRWVREPHPIDQFSGTTPLEAAGISIELDQLSRQYNVSFIKNDSRPGGVLAVDHDSLSDQEMDRIERRFRGGGQGAFEAGQLTVIASGKNGGVTYTDLSARPRDMAYKDSASNAKTEILAAFGIGESLLGNASGSTFANSEQEEYNFWTKRMKDHNALIASAFADDVEPGLTPFIDTSSVEALELGERRRREEARTEVTEGLRSVNEYRPLARLDEVDAPQARALWISPQKAPVPMNEADAAALLGPQQGDGGGGGQAPGGDAPEGPLDTATTDAVTAKDVVQEALGQDQTGVTVPTGQAAAAVNEARAQTRAPVEGDAAAAVTEARSIAVGPPIWYGDDDAAPAAAAVQAAVEQKAKPLPQSAPMTEFTLPDHHAASAESALVAAIVATLARQQGVITARVESPKYRRGTRLWQASTASDTRTGGDPLDVERIVNTARWVDELEDTASPIVQAAVVGAGAEFLAAIVAAGAAQALEDENYEHAAGNLTVQMSMAVLDTLRAAMVDFLADLTASTEAAAATATHHSEVTAKVADYYAARGDKFARTIGGDLAHMAVHGAVQTVAERVAAPQAPRTPIVREWVSRRDTRVRPTHVAVDGTVLPVGEPFSVGGFPMRFPQDPAGPPQERYGCRCRCIYRVSPGANLTIP